MWPWGHLALGYFLVLPNLLTRGLHDDRRVIVWFAVGTQFPDLVDKPLAWTFSVLPYGRTLAHSVLVLGLAVVGLRVVWGIHRRWRVFVVGWGSHILGDALYPLLAGDIEAVAFVGWPLAAHPEASVDQSFLAHFRSLSLTGQTAFEIGLFVLAVVTYVGIRHTSGFQDNGDGWLSGTFSQYFR